MLAGHLGGISLKIDNPSQLVEVLPHILDHVYINPATGCWEYVGSRNHKNYGRVRLKGKTKLVHVVVARFVGITDPMVLHTCDNPPCFNPTHLAGGTNSSNQRDSGDKRRHKNSKKDRCPKGHEYTRTFINKIGRAARRCYTCEYDARNLRRLA